MAMSTENLKDEAITQIQAELEQTKRVLGLNLAQIHFIFGLEDDLKGDTHQTILQDAADWFEAKPWVNRVHIKWYKCAIRLIYKPEPS